MSHLTTAELISALGSPMATAQGEEWAEELVSRLSPERTYELVRVEGCSRFFLNAMATAIGQAFEKTRAPEYEQAIIWLTRPIHPLGVRVAAVDAIGAAGVSSVNLVTALLRIAAVRGDDASPFAVEALEELGIKLEPR